MEYFPLTKVWLLLPAKLRLSIKKILNITNYPDLSDKEYKLDIKESPTKLNIHFGTVIGNHSAANLLDSSLAYFFLKRGHQVSVLLCDGAFKACLNCSIWKSSKKDMLSDNLTQSPMEQGLCDTCFKNSDKLWKSTGVKIYYISKLIDQKTQKKIDDFFENQDFKEYKLVYDNLDMSEDVVAGCLRYLCKGDEQKITRELFSRYAYSAVLLYEAYQKIFEQESINVGLWVHGIYMPHGVINTIFKSKKVDFYNYNTSYRANRFYFTKNDTYHHIFPQETAEKLNLDGISQEELLTTKDYLISRETGSQDWQQFNDNPDEDPMNQLKKLGFKNDTNDLAVLFTNVVWDARLHFKENIYSKMEDWIDDTVNFFRQNPNKNLIIRVHPGELISHSVSRERVNALDCLVDLPENIILVDAESKISSYFLARLSDLNLVFATKMAMELSIIPSPVICTGDAWVRGKGATIDPFSRDEYIRLLSENNWSSLFSQKMSNRGLAYAHHFFEKKPLLFNYFSVAKDRKSFTTDPKKLFVEAEDTNSALYTLERAIIDKTDIQSYL